MTVYITGWKIYAYLSGAWSEITAEVNMADDAGWIQARWGIAGNSPLDRLADTGPLNFTLNNATGKYSPDLAGAVTGWKKGVPVKLVITYDGADYVRFRGAVDMLQIQAGTRGERRVAVTVLDWLDYAAKYPLVSPGIQADKRADQALTTLVPTMPIQPQATDYDTGINTFPALFDTVTTRTKAYTEFSKLVFSEVGYIYLRKDRVGGETLVFEGNHYRHGLRDLTPIPKSAAESGFLLKEDGGFLLKEDGGKIVLDETEMLYINNTMMSMEVIYGENLINRMTVMAYPKRYSDAPEVLFRAASPIFIGSGETITFRGSYSDPVGGAQVNAESDTMIPPEIDVDYKMWAEKVGTGTDLTPYLTVVADYGTEGVTYTLTNSSIYYGYIKTPNLQARGYGIYAYNPIEGTEESAASYNEYGYQPETLLQLYQRELTSGILEAQKILEAEKQPRTVLKKVSMNANRSSQMMQAFLTLDVGDLVHIKEDQTGIDGYYYIQAVEFTIIPGGAIMFSWIVKQSFSLLMGLSLIACEFAGGAATDGVNYGYLPQVSNLPERTMSAWIYVHTAPSTVSYFIMGPMSDAAGAIISVGATGAIEFPRVIQYYQKGVTGAGGWRTPNESVPLNAWTHVLATRDSSNPVNLPIVYINGVAQSLTELASQGGATTDETGANFVVGNAKTIAWDYIRPFDGLIKDARVYNRILTAAEALTLASGGIVTDGLVFQTPCVRVKELTAYTDLTLTAEEKLLDNLYGAVGSPHGSPVTRLGAFFPVFDAATGNAATTDVTISDTHTASGLNRFAKVSLYLSGAVTDLVVTYDGVAMTQIGTKTVPDGGKRVYVFGLVNPPTGSKTVTASWTTSRLSRIITETFAFVNQTTPYDTVTTANGSGIAQALAAIASSAEKLVSDSLISSATGHVLTVGAGQTLTKEETSALAARVSTSTEPGAASVVMSWSTDISVDWAQIGFNLLPI